MPQIHRAGDHSVGLVSRSNMDNQQAETLKKYSTENQSVRQCNVVAVSVGALGIDGSCGTSIEECFKESDIEKVLRGVHFCLFHVTRPTHHGG